MSTVLQFESQRQQIDATTTHYSLLKPHPRMRGRLTLLMTFTRMQTHINHLRLSVLTATKKADGAEEICEYSFLLFCLVWGIYVAWEHVGWTRIIRSCLVAIVDRVQTIDSHWLISQTHIHFGIRFSNVPVPVTVSDAKSLREEWSWMEGSKCIGHGLHWTFLEHGLWEESCSTSVLNCAGIKIVFEAPSPYTPIFGHTHNHICENP